MWKLFEAASLHLLQCRGYMRARDWAGMAPTDPELQPCRPIHWGALCRSFCVGRMCEPLQAQRKEKVFETQLDYRDPGCGHVHSHCGSWKRPACSLFSHCRAARSTGEAWKGKGLEKENTGKGSKKERGRERCAASPVRKRGTGLLQEAARVCIVESSIEGQEDGCVYLSGGHQQLRSHRSHTAAPLPTDGSSNDAPLPALADTLPFTPQHRKAIQTCVRQEQSQRAILCRAGASRHTTREIAFRAWRMFKTIWKNRLSGNAVLHLGPLLTTTESHDGPCNRPGSLSMLHAYVELTPCMLSTAGLVAPTGATTQDAMWLEAVPRRICKQKYVPAAAVSAGLAAICIQIPPFLSHTLPPPPPPPGVDGLSLNICQSWSCRHLLAPLQDYTASGSKRGSFQVLASCTRQMDHNFGGRHGWQQADKHSLASNPG